MDRGTWRAIVYGVARVGHDLATKPPPHHKPHLIFPSFSQKVEYADCKKATSLKSYT